MKSILTTTYVVAGRAVSQVHINNRSYPINTAEGAALERAINNSLAVRGVHQPHQTITVQDDIAGARTQYPIVRDKFLSLLQGYGVRQEMAKIFNS